MGRLWGFCSLGEVRISFSLRGLSNWIGLGGGVREIVSALTSISMFSSCRFSSGCDPGEIGAVSRGEMFSVIGLSASVGSRFSRVEGDGGEDAPLGIVSTGAISTEVVAIVAMATKSDSIEAASEGGVFVKADN